MKKFFCFILVPLLLICSCSSGAYTDTLSCEEIRERIISAVGDEEYLELDSGDAEYYFSLDGCREYSVRYSSSTNDIGEFGIFHAEDEEAALELLEECRGYLKEKQTEQRAFIQSYAPTELKKLDGAEAYRFGNYVVFTILEKELTMKIKTSIHELLSS